jgi:hypothetical protein
MQFLTNFQTGKTPFGKTHCSSASLKSSWCLVQLVPKPGTLTCPQTGEPYRLNPRTWIVPLIWEPYQLAALTAMSSECPPYGPPFVASNSNQQKRSTTLCSSQSSLFRNLSTSCMNLSPEINLCSKKTTTTNPPPIAIPYISSQPHSISPVHITAVHWPESSLLIWSNLASWCTSAVLTMDVAYFQVYQEVRCMS